MAYFIIKAKYGWLHVFNLRTLLSPFQCRMQERLLHFQQNIIIIIIFTYITYSIYSYIYLKCTQFLKINAGNSLSDGIMVGPTRVSERVKMTTETYTAFLKEHMEPGFKRGKFVNCFGAQQPQEHGVPQLQPEPYGLRNIIVRNFIHCFGAQRSLGKIGLSYS